MRNKTRDGRCLGLMEFLEKKSLYVKKETLKIHCLAPETRIASSLSDIEIFVVLYYGKILNFDAKKLRWENRDRLIVSKGHGAISLYPIYADMGFFDKSELKKVCKKGSNLGSIPDCSIPGFESLNGSLGQGLGEACGIAIALKRKRIGAKVFVLLGDGELNEGSVWEALMFASHYKLNNLFLIIDNNKISMLDYCKNIIDLEPLEKKFEDFNLKVKIADGHNVEELYNALRELKEDRSNQPKVLIANTKKGKDVPQLEDNPLCHVRSFKKHEVLNILKRLKC